MDPLDWNDLHYYLAAVQGGTLTRAADILGVNRTTVGRRMAALEARIGQAIFEQTAIGYQPTAAGHAVLAAASEMQSHIRVLREQLDGSSAPISGPLKLAIPLGAGRELIAALADFTRQYPQVRLEIANSAQPLVMINQRKADLAIVLGNSLPDHIQACHISTLTQGLYAADHYLQQRPANLPLTQHDWIGWSETMADSAGARWMQSHLTPETKVRLDVDTHADMAAAVSAGLGVGQLWDVTAASLTGLQALQKALPSLTTELWICHLKVVPQLERAQRLVEFCQQALAQPLCP